MSADPGSYDIYSLKTGQPVARISAEGVVQGEGDPQAVATLKSLMQHEIIIRQLELDADPQNLAEEEYDPYPEESMCYIGLVTLSPGDPSYFKAFLRRLPYVSFYAARPSDE
jgi:hypothetical protein